MIFLILIAFVTLLSVAAHLLRPAYRRPAPPPSCAATGGLSLSVTSAST